MAHVLPPEALRFKVGDLIGKKGFKFRNIYRITSISDNGLGGGIEVVVPMTGRNDVGHEYSTWFYSVEHQWERVTIVPPKGLILKRNRVLDL